MHSDDQNIRYIYMYMYFKVSQIINDSVSPNGYNDIIQNGRWNLEESCDT